MRRARKRCTRKATEQRRAWGHCGWLKRLRLRRRWERFETRCTEVGSMEYKVQATRTGDGVTVEFYGQGASYERAVGYARLIASAEVGRHLGY